MKANRSTKKTGGVFWLLLKNYIIFTIIAIMGFNGISWIVTQKFENVLAPPTVDDLMVYTDKLVSEEYEKLPIRKLLGKHSFIEVLNQNNQVIYQSSSFIHQPYTDREINFLFDFSLGSQVNISSYYNVNGQKQTVISIVSWIGDTMVNDFMVLDEFLQVSFSTLPNSPYALTPHELDFLTNEVYANYTMSKYNFYNQHHEPRTMILYVPKVSDNDLQQAMSAYNNAVYAFAGFYILMIVLLALWLNRKVKKPIELLNTAILDVADGGRNKEIHYQGPAEFVQICDSFNEMSANLGASEARRQQLENDKQRMLADISHDLKTPITVIQGYSKAICDGLVSDDKKEQYLNTIYQKSNALNELINAFYDYSKLEHPDFSLVLDQIDLCEYAREYLANKYDEIALAGFNLEVDIPDMPIFYQIDVLQLKRVFENIIGNSLKHNVKGTTIYFAIQVFGVQVQISIADDGIGIPVEIANDIFEPFVVGDISRHNKHGSGLGLAIAQKIVIAHQGVLNLQIPPENNYKTQFVIFFNLSVS